MNDNMIDLSKNNWCYFIPVDGYVEGRGFVPSVVRRDDKGHYPMVGRGPEAAPWYWGEDYQQALEICKDFNEKLGLDEKAVDAIIWSSMCAKRDLRYLKSGKVFGEFNKVALKAAFDKVCDQEDWRAPIDAVIDIEDAAITVAAIEFFTGVAPTLKGTIAKGCVKVRVECCGYRNGPCGP